MPGHLRRSWQWRHLPLSLRYSRFLKEKQPFTGFGKSPKALAMAAMLKKIDKNYKSNPEIKWNFTKFLVNRQGEVVARFEPTESMKKVKEAVASLI